MSIILRTLENNKFKKSNKLSNHLSSRKQRLRLSIESSDLIYHYEVYKKKDNVKQVHSLYNDGALFVHNIKTGLVVTVILLNRNDLAKYLSFTGESFSDYPTAHKCAKLHERIVKNETDEVITDIRERKNKLLEMS